MRKSQRWRLAGVLVLLLLSLLHVRVQRAITSEVLARYPTTAAACSTDAPFFDVAVHSDAPPSMAWRDCLPLRMHECGLLVGDAASLRTHPATDKKCRSAIGHRLLLDAVDALHRQNHVAFLIGPALRHVWEFEALPPSVLEVDVATSASDSASASLLWRRGVATFIDAQRGRVSCIAAHHPLASLVGDGSLPSVVGPDSGIPYLRWTHLEVHNSLWTLTTTSHVTLRGSDATHYVHQSLFPLRCRPLYTGSIPTPHFPSAFFDTTAPSPTYPSVSCEAYCAPPNATRIFAKNTVPNLPRCARDDAAAERFHRLVHAVSKDAIAVAAQHTVDLAPLETMNALRDAAPWRHCLPMQPQTCDVADKSTLFETPRGRPCRSAVLHLLLDDILEVLRTEYYIAFVHFGTLLGAWRYGRVLAHTPDVDIAVSADVDWDYVQELLWARGYFLFHTGVHSACMARHHPVASLVYAPHAPVVTSPDHGTPYVDLYLWWPTRDNEHIHVQTAVDELPRTAFFPLRCDYSVFGTAVPSMQYPEGMFLSEYGPSYVLEETKHALLGRCDAYCDRPLQVARPSRS
ncbi:hypothetical protein SDRG_14112 [Saprolegnia diclina VS20]|uniref:Uncharacterized protein n=1 Tax=Saprolegnia diclina (strain VS20) TaxID=1156394 RepID=T0Q403_SAPDV|nr:hypothetical protein SDRG_14112 [Saprolegnia diclina VS20]EQC28155.1 hypothetical protein SDRG_14112 [Saprolegnia diclina VS20]|eukprot:XP_008618441.1 hypothetical protein SDRG_14112 [Saprolegnia diclina VS20]